MPVLRCPICGGDVELPDDVLPGEIIEHDCGASLEVIAEESKFELKLLEDIGEDWGE